MSTIEILPINTDSVYAEEIADIVERAFDYFPYNLWDGVEIIGPMKVDYDTEILIDKEAYKAHEYIHLVKRLKKLKDVFKIKNPLIGVSYDPFVRIYNAYEGDGFKRFVEVMRDYVYEDTVIYSLFGAPSEKYTDAMVHTLGHVSGLRHHNKPVDIMFMDLIEPKKKFIDIENWKINFRGFFGDYFCKKCKQQLKKYLENP
jgi:hypothetical protein